MLNIELTCPAEEGIEAAKERKEGRYFLLNCAVKDRGWASSVATLEVGARGFARTAPRLPKQLGRGPSTDIKHIANIVARGTYAVYLARDSSDWDMNRELLE